MMGGGGYQDNPPRSRRYGRINQEQNGAKMTTINCTEEFWWYDVSRNGIGWSRWKTKAGVGEKQQNTPPPPLGGGVPIYKRLNVTFFPRRRDFLAADIECFLVPDWSPPWVERICKPKREKSSRRLF